MRATALLVRPGRKMDELQAVSFISCPDPLGQVTLSERPKKAEVIDEMYMSAGHAIVKLDTPSQTAGAVAIVKPVASE